MNDNKKVANSQHFLRIQLKRKEKNGMNVLKLKELREKNNLSQRSLAKLLDVQHMQYWRWENGLVYPNTKQLLKICKVLHCTPNDVFGIHGIHSVVFDEVIDK